MSRMSKTCLSLMISTSALVAMPVAAQTAPEIASADSTAEPGGGDIIVTGTRALGTQAAESAAPIQLLSESALEKVGQPNLNQALTQLVPSFQAQTQGTDMASFSLSARLRGLSPNHTLVMVNGKRRHGNSILQVINGAFGGSAAPSIDLIPPDIVQRIEVLQDGAAAQYGSDAIAGVINIILKNNTSGVTLKGTTGQYYDGEGTSYSTSGNIGLPVGDNGFLDISLFHRRNAVTTVGDGQFSVRNYNGTTVTNINSAFTPIYNALNARNGTAGVNGGQPASKLTLAFYNFGYDFGGVEFYSFGDASYRHGDALQGYRVPNRVCTPASSTATLPSSCLQSTVTNGLVPHIEVKQDEFQFTNGLKGAFGEWNWDLAASYSEDVAKVYTTKSANASLFSATGFTPTDFYDGKFEFRQFTSTLDVRKEFDIGFSDPLTFAIGSEYRYESYTIGQGDAGSLYIEGGQSFPGYSATDAGTIKRKAKAVYVDFATKPTPEWTVDIAGRYEHYSDFGDTTIGKFTTRYDFSRAIAVRGTVSTGFRAPSLQESGYSATNVGPTSAVLQLAPSSAAATSAGFGALRPEKSLNISLGTVLRPMPRMVISIDGYYIRVKDRIVSSGNITGQNAVASPNPAIRVLTPLINGLTPYDLVTGAITASGKFLDPTVVQSGQLSIQTFTNGIDTTTKGLEFSARYPLETGLGKFDLSWGVNYNVTKVKKSRLGQLFNLQAEAVIEQASPKIKSVFGVLFTTGAFSANMRANYYSKTVALVQPNSASTTPRPIGSPTNGYYKGIVKAATIFDLELGYDVTDFFNLAVGSNNLFDKKPEIPPLVADYNSATWPTTGRSPYINGGGSLNGPYNHGPYGTNGGYYYARATFKF